MLAQALCPRDTSRHTSSAPRPPRSARQERPWLVHVPACSRTPVWQPGVGRPGTLPHKPAWLRRPGFGEKPESPPVGVLSQCRCPALGDLCSLCVLSRRTVPVGLVTNSREASGARNREAGFGSDSLLAFHPAANTGVVLASCSRLPPPLHRVRSCVLPCPGLGCSLPPGGLRPRAGLCAQTAACGCPCHPQPSLAPAP